MLHLNYCLIELNSRIMKLNYLILSLMLLYSDEDTIDMDKRLMLVNKKISEEWFDHCVNIWIQFIYRMKNRNINVSLI